MRMLLLFFFLLLASSLPSYAQDRDADVNEILLRLDAGESVDNLVINLLDIFFKTGTAELEPEAAQYLNQVLRLLEKAPNINLFIQGHADNVGSPAFNNRLSLNRAEAVGAYLTQRGIDPNRLTAKGFGSSRPVADNTTAEGRSRNRRVAMLIQRNSEEVKTIQDIIVRRNGSRFGALVHDFDGTKVVYQQFTSEDTLTIASIQVDTIYFSDGRVEIFKRPEPVKKEKFNLSVWWNENIHIFDRSQSFHRGNFVLGLGIGPRNNVDIALSDHQTDIPPVLLIAELPVGRNLGVGITAGAMGWSKPKTPGIDYVYYVASARVAYHLNLGSQWDVYAGVTFNARMGTVTNGTVTLSRQKYDPGMLLGARYYFNNTLGVFVEIGDESVSFARGGVAIKFGK